MLGWLAIIGMSIKGPLPVKQGHPLTDDEFLSSGQEVGIERTRSRLVQPSMLRDILADVTNSQLHQLGGRANRCIGP